MPLRNRLQSVLLSASLLSLWAFAQAPATMTVSPNKATMLVGETRTFRAVGKDGRIRHNVRWEISPGYAAAITANGDEATVAAREASPSVMLTASAEGDSADASIEIRAKGDMTAGTTLWSVAPTPGCKATQMIQAVPSANGPDLYVQETCPEGTMLRALTADGRELWRKMMAGTAASAAVPVGSGPYIGFLPNGATPPVPGKSVQPAGAHINPHSTSVCDAVSVGMTRDDAFKAAAEHNVKLDSRQRQADTWLIEEEGSRCTISFDAKTGNVVKKKKTIVTD
ncbi:MAG: hypothetical protein WAM79_09225 [Candidatus Sulfotelmatobacter sp.]